MLSSLRRQHEDAFKVGIWNWRGQSNMGNELLIPRWRWIMKDYRNSKLNIDNRQDMDKQGKARRTGRIVIDGNNTQGNEQMAAHKVL